MPKGDLDVLEQCLKDHKNDPVGQAQCEAAFVAEGGKVFGVNGGKVFSNDADPSLVLTGGKVFKERK